MFVLLGSLLRLLVSPPNLRDIALENLALRQQLAVFKPKCPRLRLRGTDRFFRVWLSRSWKDWHWVLIIVDRRRSWPGIARAFACFGAGFPGGRADVQKPAPRLEL